MSVQPSAPDEQPTEAVTHRSQRGEDFDAGTEADLPAGARLGEYRILELLGRGGMGTVYRAEQLEPVVRIVALKLMTGQRMDADHLALFEVERQILARMQHPHIAQIFDAGTTPEGIPYFAMEHINGQSITAYCEQKRLSLGARVDLLVQVCEGVQHAHHKGVIHRDLKPGNILVTEVDGRPAPKIIDFGIATAAQRSRDCAAAAVAGTPDYMSPEQSQGSVDVDARSDVYALGVLMYELVSGRRPAISTGPSGAVTGADTTLRRPSAVLHDEPPAQAERIADARRLTAGALHLALRQELDWVVLRALQRERDARFATPLALAEELQRWKRGQALHSVPATRRYRWGKFYRRHRLALAASAAVLASLLIGTGLLFFGLVEARQQRQMAEQRQFELERVTRFQSAMLEGIDIEAMGALLLRLQRDGLASDPEAGTLVPDYDRLSRRWSGPDIARQLVDTQMLGRSVEVVERDFRDQPLLAAELLASLANVYEGIGLYPQAETIVRKTVDLRISQLGEAHLQTLAASAMLGSVINSQGRLEEAKDILADAQARLSGSDPNAEEVVAVKLISALNADDRGEREAAVVALKALRDGLLPVRAEDDRVLGKVTNNLAIALARLGRTKEARPLLEALLPIRIQGIGAEHPDTLSSMTNLAVIRSLEGELEPALELQTRLLAVSRRRFGDLHPRTLNDVNNRGSTLFRLKRYDEARPLLEEALRSRRQVLGSSHPQTLRSMNNLASLLNLTGDTPAALALQREVVEVRRSGLGGDHPDTLRAQLSLATVLRDAGLLDEARANAQAVRDRLLTLSGADDFEALNALGVLASIAREAGRLADAEGALRERHVGLTRTKGADDPAALSAALDLFVLLDDQGRDIEALLPELRALAAREPESLDERARDDRQEAIERLAKRR